MGSGLKAIPGKLEDITLNRSGAGAYVAGRWIKSATTPVSIKASVQPVSPEDLMYLPETMRTTDSKVLYSPDEIKTANEGTGLNADNFTYDGEIYEVHKVWNWKSGILDHFKAIAVRAPRVK